MVGQKASGVWSTDAYVVDGASHRDVKPPPYNKKWGPNGNCCVTKCSVHVLRLLPCAVSFLAPAVPLPTAAQPAKPRPRCVSRSTRVLFAVLQPPLVTANAAVRRHLWKPIINPTRLQFLHYRSWVRDVFWSGPASKVLRGKTHLKPRVCAI